MLEKLEAALNNAAYCFNVSEGVVDGEFNVHLKNITNSPRIIVNNDNETILVNGVVCDTVGEALKTIDYYGYKIYIDKTTEYQNAFS